MKTIFIGFLSLLIVVVLCAPASAFSHANRYGGHTSGSYGSGATHTNAYGGSTSGKYGSGATHTNVYGGSTSGRYGSGAEHTGAYGGTTYHAPVSGAYPGYHPGYPPPPPHPVYAYHPPVAVPYYSSSGCTGCAAAAGAVVGMAAGSAVASANTSAAASSAYSAGVAAGAASTTYAMGVNYAALPAGCATPTVQGTTYYLCGNTWFKPSYGANGVYYRVVPTP